MSQCGRMDGLRRDSLKQQPAKTYEGVCSDGEVFVTVNGQALDRRFDLRNHSPTGFEWGYGGSGPAQLALAIVADHLADTEKALAVYQEFKARVVAGVPRTGWSLDSDFIGNVLSEIELELGIR